MDTTQLVSYTNLNTILCESNSLIIVLFPNYEDRTHGIIDNIQQILRQYGPEKDINFLMFCLKNKSNNNMLLEDLKEQNIELIKKTLNCRRISEYWLEYPSNFSPNALKMPIQHILKEKSTSSTSGEKADILLDISTIPKSILFHLCEDIKEFIRGKSIGKIFFAYCLPKEYSQVPYAQDIGLLKGLFSGKALYFPPSQCIHTIMFPSRLGHEGKLLCDSLDSLSRNTSYSIFFPIHKDNFIASLDIMQANQSLIDRESYLNFFYCTLDDAIKSLDKLFYNEATKIHRIIKSAKDETKTEDAVTLVPQVYLVAPFGAKIFFPIAYFELLYLRSVAPEIVSVEIVNVKGFQYTSSYSLGIGDIACFELDGVKIADVLLENQDL